MWGSHTSSGGSAPALAWPRIRPRTIASARGEDPSAIEIQLLKGDGNERMGDRALRQQARHFRGRALLHRDVLGALKLGSVLAPAPFGEKGVAAVRKECGIRFDCAERGPALCDITRLLAQLARDRFERRFARID